MLNDKGLQVILHHKKDDSLVIPAVLDGLSIKHVISGTPSVLECSFIHDINLHIEEGDTLQVSYNDTPVFFGYVFTITKEKDDVVKVKAYDQLRYLKNKDYFYYENKTAGQLLSCLADDYGLKTGTIEDTKYTIKQKRESNVEIMTMIQNAIDATLINTKELYVLYDDNNALSLRSPKSLEIPILIDGSTAENFSYESSIDGETYNSIKLITDDTKNTTGKNASGDAINSATHKIVYAPSSPSHMDDNHVKQWGLLRLVKTVKPSDYTDGLDKVANQLLVLHNAPKRKLSITKALGDTRVRAGSIVYCTLSIMNDTEIASKMLVTEVTHTFTNGLHTMDLHLKGGLIND